MSLLLFFAGTGAGDPELPARASPPTNLAVEQTNAKSVLLSWDASTGAVDPPRPAFYKVYVNGVWDDVEVPYVQRDPVVTVSITGLSPNTAYSFYVTCVDSADDESDTSNTVNVTTSRNTDSGIFGGFRKRQTSNEYANKGMYG